MRHCNRYLCIMLMLSGLCMAAATDRNYISLGRKFFHPVEHEMKNLVHNGSVEEFKNALSSSVLSDAQIMALRHEWSLHNDALPIVKEIISDSVLYDRFWDMWEEASKMPVAMYIQEKKEILQNQTALNTADKRIVQLLNTTEVAVWNSVISIQYRISTQTWREALLYLKREQTRVSGIGALLENEMQAGKNSR